MSMYNLGAVYAVVGRVTTGTTVDGYIVITKDDNKRIFVNKSEFEVLALSKKIYNCSAQAYNNCINLKGIGCKLSKLPRYTRDCTEIKEVKEDKQINQVTIVLKYKVRDGREVIGYIVKEKLPTGQVVDRYKSREALKNEAAKNRVYGVKCQSNGDKIILRSVNGYSLNNIPEITKEECRSKVLLTI